MVFVEQAQRRIPVQYAKRMVGRRMYGGTSTYIPLKVNMAGVIPVIFASSLLYLPSLAVNLADSRTRRAGRSGSQDYLVRGDHPLYMVIYVALIIFFTYFYVAITFNPNEVADNMKKYGGFIPGIRAGRPTAEYLDYVLSRITLPGAMYLGADRADPAHRAGALQCQPELPVRRHRDPDHRRCRPRDREADREPAAAAQLRRVPPLVRLVLVGPPGAGKGTQAQFIASHFGVPKISTGDIFRANVSEGTALGLEARKYMDAGDLVPDEVTIAMVATGSRSDDAAEGFLLDGFPRTVHQAEVLDEMLAEHDATLDVVLELVVDDEEVVRRLSGRRTCRQCGHVWHLDFDPPAGEGVCDRCGGELFQRDDDSEDTIRHRLEVYAEQTAPLIGYYGDRGLLRGVDATGAVEDVTERAIDALRRFGD